MNNPLVSYCVKCYNQERYIAKALESAFGQTYEPLEILICDDASKDCSDEIIRRMIADYQASGGRHKVRYYKNEINLGNLGNWQHMCELAEGELLVKADGDDYSTFDRTEKLIDAWQKDSRHCFEVVSDGVAVSSGGNELWSIKWSVGAGLGGFAAFSRKCFSEFPDLIDGVAHEGADDVVYINRAMMLSHKRGIAGASDVIYVPEELVYYRQGSGETSSGLNYVKMQTRGFLFMLASAKQLLADVEVARKWLDEKCYLEFKNQYEYLLKHHQALRELWLGKSYCERKRGYDELMQLKSCNPKMAKFMLLPRWVSHSILNTVFCLNYHLKCILKKIHS